MKAVILAAGIGKRMESNQAKPLLKLFGIPIIEHTIRKLRGYDIIVVYHKKEIEEFIKKKFPHIKLIYNNEPERENGWSLYLAKDYVKEDFILLMADHFYGEKFFNFNKKDKTTLFVSKYCSNAIEATKVKVRGNKIVNIGKSLDDYDFFDTGFFYCKKEIFDYIDEKKEKIKLSDIIFNLAKEGEIKYEVIDDFWIDIDTKEELKKAEKLLQKKIVKETDGIVSRNINRKISTKITKYIAKYDFITPNLIAFLSFLIALFSAFLFYIKEFILAAIIAQISSIFDGCDGEIARIKNMKTKFGGFFDSILDRYADIFIVSGMLFSYNNYNFLTIIAFILALIGCILPSYAYHITKLRLPFFGRDVRLFLIMIGGILAHFNIKFIFYTLFFIGIITNFGVILLIIMGHKVL